jgi:hypothetical protein
MVRGDLRLQTSRLTLCVLVDKPLIGFARPRDHGHSLASPDQLAAG